jgi:hypothetical protein
LDKHGLRTMVLPEIIKSLEMNLSIF